MKNDQDVAVRVSGPQTGHDADASTRQRVAQSILEHGPSTAAALAERLGLTAAAVRRHLDVLLDRGLLVAREQRVYGTRGRGRPAKVFSLTDSGRSDFYSAYDDIAIQAIEYLAQAAGPEAVTGFAAARAGAAEARYADTLVARDPEQSPAQALAAALSADGYVASVRPSALGEQLCQHHCPVAHVAEKFPQLCEVETELFSRLLGVHVQRLATIAHGDGVCTTHVPRASGTSDVPRSAGAPVPPVTPASSEASGTETPMTAPASRDMTTHPQHDAISRERPLS